MRMAWCWRRSRTSTGPLEEPFRIFSGGIGQWWPVKGHSGACCNLAARAGRVPGNLPIRSPGMAILTKGVEAVRSMVARTFATYVAGKGDSYLRRLSRLGHGQLCERIRGIWRSGGAGLGASVVPSAFQQLLCLVTNSSTQAR